MYPKKCELSPLQYSKKSKLKTEIKNLRIILDDHFEYCDLDHFIKKLLAEIKKLQKTQSNFKDAKVKIDRILLKAITSHEDQNHLILKNNTKSINEYADNIERELKTAKSHEEYKQIHLKAKKSNLEIEKFESQLIADQNKLNKLINSVKPNFEQINSNFAKVKTHRRNIFRTKVITNFIKLLPIFVLLIIGISRTYIFKLIPNMQHEHFILIIATLILFFYWLSKRINNSLKHSIMKPKMLSAIRQIEKSETDFLCISKEITSEYSRIVDKMEDRYDILKEIKMKDIVRRFVKLSEEYGS